MSLRPARVLRSLTAFFTSLVFYASTSAALYTLSLHDALPISHLGRFSWRDMYRYGTGPETLKARDTRSEEHTSELQSLRHLVCRLLLEKKKYEESRRVPSSTAAARPSARRRPQSRPSPGS